MITFEWDTTKDKINQEKHGVSFEKAQEVFFDKERLIFEDAKHSEYERRFFCVGKVQKKILTVRFTIRDRNIRIFGAAYERKGKKLYEER